MKKNPFHKIEMKKLNSAVEVLNHDDLFKRINRRILILSIVIMMVFALVIVKLAMIQIVHHEDYVSKLENYAPQEQRFTTPRGEIFDRKGKVIVKSVSAHNITYFPPKATSNEDKWLLAQKFAKQFKVKYDYMSQSDLQDLYLFLYRDKDGNPSDGSHLLSQAELLSITTSGDKNKLIRSKITKEMVDEIASEADKNAFSVYLLMNQAPANQSKVIVENASNEDVAYLVEHKDEYLGFDIDFSSWKRVYPYKDTFRDVLGSVSTSKQGVPSEERDYYQALGYYINDRVGISGLEKQYESLLGGSPKISEISYGDDGIAVFNEKNMGKKGYDLHLTIDIELEQKIDKILEDVLKKYGGASGREAFSQAFVLLINPNTGEILSMNGAIKNKDDSITKFASGTYLNNYQVGSVAKGATVYMMLSEGVQTPTSTEYDAPMNIAGAIKSSYTNMGSVNAVTALEKSSNVYMWKSVIDLAGGTYIPNAPLNISSEKTQETLYLMRQYYSSFGLGVKTGLDVPNESLGNTGYSTLAGNLLDYSIGQYDSYSPIQLAQYVSTIANGGKRIQPKLVNYATEVNSDYKIFQNKTKILSQLPNTDNLKVVRDGFRACITGNHCGLEMNTMDKGIAAKTGTAQVGKYTNTTEIGFAPYDNPEIAFVVTAPTSSANSSSQEANICSNVIAPRVMEAYFELYRNDKKKD